MKYYFTAASQTHTAIYTSSSLHESAISALRPYIYVCLFTFLSNIYKETQLTKNLKFASVLRENGKRPGQTLFIKTMGNAFLIQTGLQWKTSDFLIIIC